MRMGDSGSGFRGVKPNRVGRRLQAVSRDRRLAVDPAAVRPAVDDTDADTGAGKKSTASRRSPGKQGSTLAPECWLIEQPMRFLDLRRGDEPTSQLPGILLAEDAFA